MPVKQHGLIVTDGAGRLVTDDYDNVLLFKSKEDATPYVPVGGRVWRVVTARIGRRYKPKPTKE